jgi:broad specificity phosphatase PhoE
MIKIIYVGHTQTTDMVAGIATGWADPALTSQGETEARRIGRLLSDTHIDAAYSADQRRAHHTAELVLEGRRLQIIQDSSLRGTNFGDFEGHPRADMHRVSTQFVEQPYPNGESRRDVVNRWRDFLDELKRTRAGQTVLICDSSVFPLEVIVNHRRLTDVLADKVATFRTFQLT